MTDIHRTIRIAYARSPLTQAQIAARAQISERTVAKVLAGHRVIADNLIAVAEALGLSISCTGGNIFPQHRAEKSAQIAGH